MGLNISSLIFASIYLPRAPPNCEYSRTDVILLAHPNGRVLFCPLSGLHVSLSFTWNNLFTICFQPAIVYLVYIVHLYFQVERWEFTKCCCICCAHKESRAHRMQQQHRTQSRYLRLNWSAYSYIYGGSGYGDDNKKALRQWGWARGIVRM